MKINQYHETDSKGCIENEVPQFILRISEQDSAIHCADKKVHVSPKDIHILESIGTAEVKIISRDELIQKHFANNILSGEQLLNNGIYRLRQAIKSITSLSNPIITVYKKGYRLNPQIIVARTSSEHTNTMLVQDTNQNKSLQRATFNILSLIVIALLLITYYSLKEENNSTNSISFETQKLPNSTNKILLMNRTMGHANSEGNFIVFSQKVSDDVNRIYKLRLHPQNDDDPEVLIEYEGIQSWAKLSPDGANVALLEAKNSIFDCKLIVHHINTAKSTTLAPCIDLLRDDNELLSLSWSADGLDLFFVGQDKESDLYGLAKYNLATNDISFLNIPYHDGYIESQPTPLSDGLLGYVHTNELRSAQIAVFDRGSEALHLSEERFQSIRGLSYHKTMNSLIFSAKKKGKFSLYYFDIEDKSIHLLDVESHSDLIHPFIFKNEVYFTTSEEHYSNKIVGARDSILSNILARLTYHFQDIVQLKSYSNGVAFIYKENGIQTLAVQKDIHEPEIDIIDKSIRGYDISPNERQIVYVAEHENSIHSLNIYNFDSSNIMVLLDDKGDFGAFRNPIWSNCGNGIIFSAASEDQNKIWHLNLESKDISMLIDDFATKVIESRDCRSMFYSSIYDDGVKRYQISSGQREMVIADLKKKNHNFLDTHHNNLYTVEEILGTYYLMKSRPPDYKPVIIEEINTVLIDRAYNLQVIDNDVAVISYSNFKTDIAKLSLQK